MEEIQCWHCGRFFPKSPRHKAQYYCLKPECQKARKAAWKRKKMREDPEYRLNQKISPDGHFKIPHLWPGQNPPGAAEDILPI
jgi:hypothetical protein